MSTIPAVEQHIRTVRQIGAQMPAGPNYAAYEAMKAAFVRQHPDATPAEYEVAMREIARACGV